MKVPYNIRIEAFVLQQIKNFSLKDKRSVSSMINKILDDHCLANQSKLL